MKKYKLNLSTKIFIGLILGLITGIILNFIPQSFIRDQLLVDGAASMGDIKKLGRIGVKTVLFYLATTAIAISISLSLSTIFKPGVGLNLSNSNLGEVTIKEATPLVEVILVVIPSNLFPPWQMETCYKLLYLQY